MSMKFAVARSRAVCKATAVAQPSRRMKYSLMVRDAIPHRRCDRTEAWPETS